MQLCVISHIDGRLQSDFAKPELANQLGKARNISMANVIRLNAAGA
jgi:hypothetical protein